MPANTIASTPIISSALGLTGAAFLFGVAARHIIGRLQNRSETTGGRMRKIYRRCPAIPGDNVRDIDTPCLVVDLEAIKRNLARMNETLAPYKALTIRPHAKSHKTPEIAQLQAHNLNNYSGVCCAKVCEAEAMFWGGVHDILLANVVVDPSKVERLAVLAKRGGNISLCFDDPDVVRVASQIARSMDVSLNALVEVNVGQNRCGVETPDPAEEALELAKLIEASPGLKFVGIQGMKCQTVTGGGTGTYLLEASSGVFTEVQPGSFIFNDVDYAKNLGENGKKVSTWSQSLFVASTVISRSVEGSYAIVDAGMKALSLDSGPPEVSGMTGVRFENAGDEHGKLIFENPADIPRVGSQLLLVPGHCDPTVNLHDFIVAVDGNKVRQVWEVTGRSPGL